VASIRTRDEEDRDHAAALARAASPDTAADRSAPEPEEEVDDYDARGTYTVAGAHLSHDLYSSFRDPLIPYVQENLGISLFAASLMVPAQSLPSLLQPFIGVLADRTSKRWFVVLAPAVAGISTSAIGLAPNVFVILILLFTAGLASAAFHTPAVALTGEYGGQRIGWAMAIFQAGGSAARGLGPLSVTGVIWLVGFHNLWIAMFLGIAASVALYFVIDTSASDAAEKLRDTMPFKPLLKARLRYVGGLLSFGLLRSIGRGPFTIFLVAYLIDIGRGDWYASISLATISFAGIFGGFAGGMMADRLGGRAVMAFSTAALVPVLYLYLFLENGSVWVVGLLVIAGIISMMSGPVELSLAQEIMPEARGTMAGIILAFRFTTMSIVALGFGALADSIGIDDAFWYIPILSLLALFAVPFLPRRGQPMPQPV
jgi:FSR family fosmidomycin resistance protein-like MFS transporter